MVICSVRLRVSQTLVQVVSVGVSHSSNEALEREWSEGETLWCRDY
jgi:hypothetical protein